jgi:hypothetical protein
LQALRCALGRYFVKKINCQDPQAGQILQDCSLKHSHIAQRPSFYR